MINKKRGLLKDTTSLIIAIIGLLLLTFAAYKLYASVVSQDSEVAKTMLNIVEAKVDAIEDGQSAKFIIRGTKDKWYLAGWGKADIKRPDKCYFKSCVCACPGTFNVKTLDGTQCQEKGICRFFDSKDISVSSLRTVIKSGTTEVSVGTTEQITGPFIKLDKNLIELTIKKSSDKLSISTIEQD